MIVHTPAALAALSGDNTNEFLGENRIFNAVARALPNECIVSYSLSFAVRDPHTHAHLLETSAIVEVAL